LIDINARAVEWFTVGMRWFIPNLAAFDQDQWRWPLYERRAWAIDILAEPYSLRLAR
jgi:hypothetical protein